MTPTAPHPSPLRHMTTTPPQLAAPPAPPSPPHGFQWLPTRAAARALACHVRTLQRRASAGRIRTRTADDGATFYAVPIAASDTPHASAPPPHVSHVASPGAAAAVAPAVAPDAAVAALAAQLERAIERALVAERLAGQLAEQLERALVDAADVRTAAAELEARHVRRGAIVRRLAAQLAALRAE